MKSIPIVESDEVVHASTFPRANVLGVCIHAIQANEAVDSCMQLLQSNGSGYVCMTGVHGVIEAHKDQRLREILNSAFLNLPDGMPTVWMGRLQGFGHMRTVRGPEFMLSLCQASVHPKLRHFLCGGGVGVAEELASALRSRFPGIQVVGTYTPPFRAMTNAEEESLAEQVKECQPDIMWIGLSTPKQEKFIGQYVQSLQVKLMITVGAAFDFHSGRKKDAPAWIKDKGLHWLYRLVQEPRRLLPRYGKIVPLFLFLAVLQIFRIRKYSLN